jgi:hypothetical protein
VTITLVLSGSQDGMSAHDHTPLPRSFTFFVALTSLAVFVQGVTAGIFVNQDGHDGWVTVHGVIADVTWVSALAATVAAWRSVRHLHHRLWALTAALFVLALAQTGIGHLISDGGMDALIVVHVPLAMAIFGLTVWLVVATAHARRTGRLIAPYADEPVGRPAEPLSVSYRS